MKDLSFTALVFGAGPAGSASAIRLSQLGVDCVLIDHKAFPRDKVCGDGISHKVLPLLQTLQIDYEPILNSGYVIRQMIIYGPQGQPLKTPVARPGLQNGFCCPRFHFDHFLFKKAASLSSAVFCPARLLQFKRTSEGFEVFFSYQEKKLRIQTRVIIVADGAHSLMAQRLGFEQRKSQWMAGLRQYFKGRFSPVAHIIYDPSLLPGYSWIFPVSGEQTNVGLMYYGFHHSLKNLFRNRLQHNPVLHRLLKGSIPVSRIRQGLLPAGNFKGARIADGAILVGDAAEFVNPLTGGGIYNALLSGIKAAEVVADAIARNDFSQQALSAYESWWKTELRPNFLVAAQMVKWLSRLNRANLLFSLTQKNRFLYRLVLMAYSQIMPEKLKKMSRLIDVLWKTRARSDWHHGFSG